MNPSLTKTGLFAIRSLQLNKPKSPQEPYKPAQPVKTVKPKRPPLPASAPKRVCQRRGVPISIRFRFRTPPISLMRSAFDRFIVVRITINKQRDAGFTARERFVHPVNGSVSFGPFLLLDSTKWNAQANELRGRDRHTIDLNEQLSTIKADIKAIYSRQQKRHQTQDAPRPTVDSVKYEYQTGFLPMIDGDRYVYPASFVVRKNKTLRQSLVQPSSQVQGKSILGEQSPLVEVMNAYLVDLHANKRATGEMAQTTYELRQSAYKYLAQYPLAQGICVYQLSPYWLERFHAWLLTQPSGRHKALGKRMNPSTASMYCRYVNEAIKWLLKQRLIEINPFGNIADLDLPGHKTKEVYSLEPSDMDRLAVFNPKPKLVPAYWWLRLICLTGLDKPDAERYALAREQYEKLTPGGKPKIVINRSKKPYNESNIPIMPALEELWDEVMGEAPRTLSKQTFYNHLDEIAAAIGYTKKLRPKIGRKTAGTMFLGRFSIHGVSNMLGHSNIRTTETYYVRVRSYHVDAELDRTSNQPVNPTPPATQQDRRNNPFIHIHKSA